MTPVTIKWSSLSQGGNVCDTRENKVKTDDGQNRHTVQLTNVTLAIVKGTHCDRRAGRHILSHYYNRLLLYRVAHKKVNRFIPLPTICIPQHILKISITYLQCLRH